MAACCATAPTPMNNLLAAVAVLSIKVRERSRPACPRGGAVLGQRRPPPAHELRGEVVAGVAPVVGRVVARREPEEPFGAHDRRERAPWGSGPSGPSCHHRWRPSRRPADCAATLGAAAASGPPRGVDEGVDADGVVRVAVRMVVRLVAVVVRRVRAGRVRAGPPPSRARGRAPCGCASGRVGSVQVGGSAQSSSSHERGRASGPCRRECSSFAAWSCESCACRCDGSVQAGSSQFAPFDAATATLCSSTGPMRAAPRRRRHLTPR